MRFSLGRRLWCRCHQRGDVGKGSPVVGFDSITSLIQTDYERLTARVAEVSASVAHLSDKELGLSPASLPADVGAYVFGFRKRGGAIDAKAREKLFRQIRPTGNELPGYVASSALGRVMEEAL
jgi:RNA ligase